MAALGVLVSLISSESSGFLTFASVLVPILAVAASLEVPALITACAIGTTAILTDAGISGQMGNETSVCLICILIGLSGMVGCISRLVRGGHDDRDSNATQTCRTRHTRAKSALVYSGVNGVHPSRPATPANVHFYKLLEAIDDIGRLMSMNYESDALIPTILNTAKSTLKCGGCDVFLWNRQQARLFHPQRLSRSWTNPIAPCALQRVCHQVIQERRIWTRVCVRSGSTLSDALDNDADLPDAVAPLTAGSELLGILVVDRVETFSVQFEQLLHALANVYALGIRNSQLYLQVEELAQRDGLTGLFNHVTFQQRLRSLVGQALKQQSPLSLVMGDIDYFKRFNDEHGHQTGDRVLRHVAGIWRSVLPDSTVLARYGGEEFIAALSGTDELHATVLAELLRRRIEAYAFSSDGHNLCVTSSFGVAELDGVSQSPDDLVAAADQRLYASKESGRNCVTGSALNGIASR